MIHFFSLSTCNSDKLDFESAETYYYFGRIRCITVKKVDTMISTLNSLSINFKEEWIKETCKNQFVTSFAITLLEHCMLRVFHRNNSFKYHEFTLLLLR